MTQRSPQFSLSYGFTFQDLLSLKGLERVQAAFETYLAEQYPHEITPYRSALDSGQATSEQLLLWAQVLEDFLATLFQCQPQVSALQDSDRDLAAVHRVKRTFIQRRVLKSDVSVNTDIDLQDLRSRFSQYVTDTVKCESDVQDHDIAHAIENWLNEPGSYREELTLAEQYCSVIMALGKGHQFYQDHHDASGLFDVPRKRNLFHLLPEGKEAKSRQRDGFALTDHGVSSSYAVTESHYCLICHDREKDSCRTGLKDGDAHKHNDLGRHLHGCPLDQKISEMSALKQKGFNLAALAMIMIDNPLVALTGHRICNDCSTSCIFQNQDPVDIPGMESQILRAVLSLSWGVEIYGLLMRWNPIRVDNPVPSQETGRSILVVGQGPAGIAMSYYMAQQGHQITAIDGLKIEDLDPNLLTKPIYSFQEISEDLEKRSLDGFGGVAEYGITSRWNKNFLKLIRIHLERYKNYVLKGGIRFGSSLLPTEAEEAFDHIALCLGAGAPKILPLENNLSRGIRQASDFLMSLQLTGAYKSNSAIGLDVHLPIVVIGGGLTAIDTATESLAYYRQQIEQFLSQLERENLSTQDLSLAPDDEERAMIWVKHAKAIREELLKDHPNVNQLLQSWGGATILYRKDLTQAPSYRLNHDEIIKAMEEGVRITPHVVPKRFEVDKAGHVIGVVGNGPEGTVMMPAGSVFIAAGTKPNTTLRKEHPEIFSTRGQHFVSDTELGHCFIDAGPERKGLYSFHGDTHPEFSGSVVKAIASAKLGSKSIHDLLSRQEYDKEVDLASSIDLEGYEAFITDTKQLSPDITRMVIKAPQAARHYKTGQYFKVQLSHVSIGAGDGWYSDPVALCPLTVEAKTGMVTFVIRRKGASTHILSNLEPGQRIELIGPAGQPLPLYKKKSVCLIGHGVNQSILVCYANQLQDLGCHVTYVSSFTDPDDDIFELDNKIAADEYHKIIENDLQGLQNKLENMDFLRFDHVLVAAIAPVLKTIRGVLEPLLREKDPSRVTAMALTSMQCMMKEICAQCLQRHENPDTGEVSYVYSCDHQLQPLKLVDMSFLERRLQQNPITEAMTSRQVR